VKKILIGCGAISIVLLLIAGVVALIFIPRSMRLGNEATAYIEDAVPQIANTWNPQALIDRASPELLAAVKSQDDWERLFTAYRQLGRLHKLEKPTGNVTSGAFSQTGSFTIGQYMANATFENGQAQVRIQVRRVGDTWKIDAFQINSDLFLPPKASPTADANR
jgi:hypothetical protein